MFLSLVITLLTVAVPSADEPPFLIATNATPGPGPVKVDKLLLLCLLYTSDAADE